jgi:hypothetical protein
MDAWLRIFMGGVSSRRFRNCSIFASVPGGNGGGQI